MSRRTHAGVAATSAAHGPLEGGLNGRSTGKRVGGPSCYARPGLGAGGLILRISHLAPLTAVAAAVLGLGQAAHADLLIEVDKSTQHPNLA
jgi:hypothetical protein